jgi:ribosome biogenesis GTPase
LAKKPRKIRVEFRKNRQRRSRRTDWTRRFEQNDDSADHAALRERVRPKGELSRRRTILVDSDETGAAPEFTLPAEPGWHAGRVLNVSGNVALVDDDDGKIYACAVSRVLRTIAIEERAVVTAGDRIHFRLAEGATSGPNIGEPQGMIERVAPRRGVLTRKYRDREQVIAANVDQLIIVCTPAEPRLKLNLVDRYIVAAEKGEIRPVVCLNKIDLVDLADFQQFVGLYSQLGYEVLVTSAQTGQGIARLRGLLRGRESVLAGQSGVGKSSLLNAIEPGLGLRVSEISQSTLHGRHTTTIAQLFKLAIGGWVVDTPGIRQFELWDVIAEELEGYFIEMRPYVPHCRFNSCSHTHEHGCAVKHAVECGEIDAGRYERYLNLFTGELEAASEE